MFSNASHLVVSGGIFNANSTSITQTNRTSKGMDLLLGWVATGAFHNSDELYDAPKCHPRTRVAVLDAIMEWVGESESARDDFILWLFGPAGAGKSAIAKRIAEIAADMGILIATFFFSRTSSERSNKDRLIATLAYQLAMAFPDIRSYLDDAIERDPTIFKKNILTQIDVLLIKPFQSISSTQVIPSKKLIIIDGLDECNDSKTQITILEAISHSFTQHKLPIVFLLVSRPETDLVTLFNSKEPLRSIHHRISLDATYQPDDDIHLFFSDKFEHIRLTHPLRSTIPISWPTQEALRKLVSKSSGQFIYASTVVKFVESSRHPPISRLNIILGISPPGKTNPFAELDAFYNHILSSVEDIQLTLRVISLYVMTPVFADDLHFLTDFMSPELFLSLEPGDIQLALIDLSSILTYHESSGKVEILHASLVDFLSDKRRSTTFYIDKVSTCTDFIRRIIQWVGPDGIRAGYIHWFNFHRGMIELSSCLPKGLLWGDILNFDLDAFIDASIKCQYKEFHLKIQHPAIAIFDVWTKFLEHPALQATNTEVQDRLKKSFESRLSIYQSDWRLQILVTLAVANRNVAYYGHFGVPYCRCVDILLELDKNDLHLVDQNALGLRHAYTKYEPTLFDMISRSVDGDKYASAVLHCMHFLSNPPKYSENKECPEMGPIYTEWKATCDMTLAMLCELLQQANTRQELVGFISNHDIHPVVHNHFPGDRLQKVNVHILAFMRRADLSRPAVIEI